jgi:7-keto-8-aminopelargonate synthetase-like enzyme
MTRQKKEIVKRINQICAWIEADQELGCGFAAARAYDGMYREIDRLEDELARLQHFASREEKFVSTFGYNNA